VKLYHYPGACSLAPHIALREAGLPFELVKVEFPSKRLESGEDYHAINPKGSVPALELDDGEILTENAVVLQYSADRAPEAHLMPPFGTLARYRVLEWLNYIATELHKGFGPLFHPAGGEGTRAAAVEAISGKFDYVEGRLDDAAYLTGLIFTVADPYLFVILGWTRIFHIDLARWPRLKEMRARIAARPAVQAALEAEGLKP
jgi:glutathione S-transferase